ncbi:MAG: lytic transglycosylase domain-containing protein [Bacteroidales bacterium]|nr:lytic transglycosylase domain-containing protein [Bacteroidales bacterium]
MKLLFEMIKKSTKKLIYATGVLTIIAVVTFAVFKLFVYSTPPDVQDDDDDYYEQMEKNYIIYSPFVPDSMNFCGEPLPLDRFDVKQAVDYEFLKIMYWQSETILYIKRMQEVFAIVEPILKKHGVPDDFKYLLVTESGMVNVVSPAKAEGYWQFLKATAQEYGLEVNSEVDERYDLIKSTEAACEYIIDAKNALGNWTLAAASYNAGRAGLTTKMDKQQEDCFYDLLLVTETSRYIYRIAVFKVILSNPRRYGFNVRLVDGYKLPDIDVIEVNTSISDLVGFAKQYGTSYKMLKTLNPWLRSDKLTNSSGKTYFISVPKQ